MTTINNDSLGSVVAPQTVRLERLLPGPIERVWAHLTEPQKRKLWLAGGPMDLRPGGNVNLEFHNATLAEPSDQPPAKYEEMNGCQSMVGEVVACNAPSLLTITWGESTGQTSEVTFELSPQGDDVLLVITHRRLCGRNMMISVAAGWHAHVAILIARLREAEPPSFWSTHTALEEQYEKRIPQDA